MISASPPNNAIDRGDHERALLQLPNLHRISRHFSAGLKLKLEDFLDHSYASLVDAELGKEMKKAPVVEWEIPKRIMTREEGGLNEVGNLLQSAMTACRS